MSKSVCLVDVAARPCTEGRPNRWWRLCDAIKGFSSLPQGVVGGSRGLEVLKKRFEAMVFYTTDELFEVLCCGIK
jgi:hypothetical protein